MQSQDSLPFGNSVSVIVAPSAIFVQVVPEVNYLFNLPEDQPIRVEFFMPKEMDHQFKELRPSYIEDHRVIINKYEGELRTEKESHHVQILPKAFTDRRSAGKHSSWVSILNKVRDFYRPGPVYSWELIEESIEKGRIWTPLELSEHLVFDDVHSKLLLQPRDEFHVAMKQLIRMTPEHKYRYLSACDLLLMKHCQRQYRHCLEFGDWKKRAALFIFTGYETIKNAARKWSGMNSKEILDTIKNHKAYGTKQRYSHLCATPPLASFPSQDSVDWTRWFPSTFLDMSNSLEEVEFGALQANPHPPKILSDPVQHRPSYPSSSSQATQKSLQARPQEEERHPNSTNPSANQKRTAHILKSNPLPHPELPPHLRTAAFRRELLNYFEVVDQTESDFELKVENLVETEAGAELHLASRSDGRRPSISK